MSRKIPWFGQLGEGDEGALIKQTDTELRIHNFRMQNSDQNGGGVGTEQSADLVQPHGKFGQISVREIMRQNFPAVREAMFRNSHLKLNRRPTMWSSRIPHPVF